MSSGPWEGGIQAFEQQGFSLVICAALQTTVGTKLMWGFLAPCCPVVWQLRSDQGKKCLKQIVIELFVLEKTSKIVKSNH